MADGAAELNSNISVVAVDDRVIPVNEILLNRGYQPSEATIVALDEVIDFDTRILPLRGCLGEGGTEIFVDPVYCLDTQTIPIPRKTQTTVEIDTSFCSEPRDTLIQNDELQEIVAVVQFDNRIIPVQKTEFGSFQVEFAEPLDNFFTAGGAVSLSDASTEVTEDEGSMKDDTNPGRSERLFQLVTHCFMSAFQS
jgi:hypothetical protein